MRFLDEVVKETKNNSIDVQCTVEVFVERLEFHVDDWIKESVLKVKQDYLHKWSRLSVKYLRMNGFGRNECKNFGIGPDSLMQVLFQMAYHRLYGSFASTYESCNTLAFKHGRTETLRPLTMEMKELVEEMNRCKKRLSNAELMRLFWKCSRKHAELTKQALSGKKFIQFID